MKLYLQKLKWPTDTDVWVCFRCRKQVHKSFVDVSMSCGGCGTECGYLGEEVALPSGEDKMAWVALHQTFLRRRRDLFAELRNSRMPVDARCEAERETAHASRPALRSLWLIDSHGSHYSNNLAKFERFFGFRAIRAEHTRVMHDAYNLDRAYFYLMHDGADWDHTVTRLLRLSQRIYPEFTLRGDGVNELEGMVYNGWQPGVGYCYTMSNLGIVRAAWWLKRDQCYTGINWPRGRGHWE